MLHPLKLLEVTERLEAPLTSLSNPGPLPEAHFSD